MRRPCQQPQKRLPEEPHVDQTTGDTESSAAHRCRDGAEGPQRYGGPADLREHLASDSSARVETHCGATEGAESTSPTQADSSAAASARGLGAVVDKEAVAKAMEDARQWLREKIRQEQRDYPVQYGDVMNMRLRNV